MRVLTELGKILLFIAIGLSTAPSLASGNREIIEKIAELNKPLQAELGKSLNLDPRLKAEVEHHRKEALKVLTDKTLSEREREQLAQSLNRKIEPTLKILFRKARIDERNYRSKIEGEVHKIAGKKGKRLNLRYIGFLGWEWQWVNLVDVYQPPQTDREVTLSVPFPFAEEEHNGWGNVDSDRELGEYTVESDLLFAGAHENLGGLAHFFEVDDNYNRIEASVALPETRYNIKAFSDIFAVFGSYASSRTEIFANNQVICSETVEHAGVVAPILYLALKSGSDNIVTSCDISAPDSGDEIVIKGVSIAGVWGGGTGFAGSTVSGTPRDLRLMLEY